jgi:hypothetical protein
MDHIPRCGPVCRCRFAFKAWIDARVASFQHFSRHVHARPRAHGVRRLEDEILKKISQKQTQSLRDNLSVDWSERESVRAKLRLMVKSILRKYKYPPDEADSAVELVLEQAVILGQE